MWNISQTPDFVKYCSQNPDFRNRDNAACDQESRSIGWISEWWNNWINCHMCTTGTRQVHKIFNTPTHNHSHKMQLAKFNSFALSFIGFYRLVTIRLIAVVRQQFVLGINCSVFLHRNFFGANQHLTLTKKSFKIAQVSLFCSVQQVWHHACCVYRFTVGCVYWIITCWILSCEYKIG